MRILLLLSTLTVFGVSAQTDDSTSGYDTPQEVMDAITSMLLRKDTSAYEQAVLPFEGYKELLRNSLDSYPEVEDTMAFFNAKEAADPQRMERFYSQIKKMRGKICYAAIPDFSVFRVEIADIKEVDNTGAEAKGRKLRGHWAEGELQVWGNDRLVASWRIAHMVKGRNGRWFLCYAYFKQVERISYFSAEPTEPCDD